MSFGYLIKQTMVIGLTIFYRILSFFIPVDEKQVLYDAFHGRSYSDNPKAIHQYLVQNESFLDFKHIWSLRQPQEIVNAKVVRYLSLSYFIALARSKYWVLNCRMPTYLYRKRSQVYLQTWHGTPLKKLAHDIKAPEGTKFSKYNLTEKQMNAAYDNDVKRYNYMISPSDFTTEVFQSAFQIDRGRLIETGYPRNDILSNFTPDDVRQTKEKYGLPLDKKVILYAPTWRDNVHSIAGYSFELEVNFHAWQEKLGNDTIVLFKPHYLIRNQVDCTAFAGFVYPLNTTADISEVYLISDVLVTDYSSVFFDFAILKRPIYFYMYDLDFYRDQLRGFYLDIDKDLPGAIIEREDELVEAIANDIFDQQKLAQFNARFNHMEDGQATARVVDIVFQQREQNGTKEASLKRFVKVH